LDVTLNVHEAQFAEVGNLQTSLAKAGVDHLGVFSSDLSNNHDADLSSLFTMTYASMAADRAAALSYFELADSSPAITAGENGETIGGSQSGFGTAFLR
jgi:hypothetical protein